MSFGFSAGDFIAAATLIKDIISAIRGNSRQEHLALELELYALQRALSEIEILKPAEGKENAVNAVKTAALMCQYPLNDFLSRLKRYEEFLEPPTSGLDVHMLRRLGKSVKWKFDMGDEVLKLRAYISGHVGSLNMRLTTLGLDITAAAMVVASRRDDEMQAGMRRQIEMLDGNTQKVESLYQIISGNLIPQLQSLTSLVGKVWNSNMQIMAYITNIQNGTTSIDIRHTFFQEPVKLEDAFGRPMPIPLEYEWSTVHAIIQDRFRSGPGHDKVSAGEYELFCTEDRSKAILEESFSLLSPGTSITMAIIIGMYHQGPKDICPRPGCPSKSLNPSKNGGMLCNGCKIWFGSSHKILPRPIRFFNPKDTDANADETKLRNRRNSLERFQRDIFKDMREDRKWYKNISVDLTDISTAFDALDRQWQLASRKASENSIRVRNREPPHKFFKGVQEFKDKRNDSQLARNSQDPLASRQIIDLWKAADQLIFEELGVSEDGHPTFDEDSTLAKLGVDCLVQLAILSRLRANLDREIVGFSKDMTVKELRALFAPKREGDSFYSIKQSTATVYSTSSSIADEIWLQLLKIICEELGISQEELKSFTGSFQELGLDSLMGLVICACFREEFPELCFPSTCFVDFDNLEALQTFVYDNDFRISEQSVGKGNLNQLATAN